MRQHTDLFRRSTAVALGALLVNLSAPLLAIAQPAAPPAVPADQSQADPPQRVGRIAGRSR